MASNSDFYVKFDSNAPDWAKALETQLAPAKAHVKSLQDMLTGLETQANQTGSKIQQALAKGLPPQVTGQGAGGGNAMLQHMDAASAELTHVITQLGTLVQGLRGMPGVVANVMRGVQTSIANIERQAAGRGQSFMPSQPNIYVKGGTPGSLQHGTAEAAVFSQVNRAVRSGALSLAGGQIGIGNLPRGIANVSRGALDKAAVDRIVGAIKAQTKVLEKRLAAGVPNTGRVAAPTNTVTKAGTKKPGKSGRASEVLSAKDEQNLKAEMEALREEIEANIKLVTEKVAKTGSKAAKDALELLRAQRAATNARLNAIERETEGLTRGEQKAARKAKAKAERESLPALTRTERDQRLEQLSLINSPGDPNFLAQVGRGKGKYGKADLKKMADALAGVGFETQISKRTPMDEIARRLVETHKRYSTEYGDAVPESLQTGGRLLAEDKISDNVRKLLGDVNKNIATAIERAQARETIRQHRGGGGQDLNEEFIGNRRVLSRGRIGYGASHVLEGMEGGVSEQQVKDAYRLLKNVTDESDIVRKRARNADFDPYDPALMSGITGKGPEARAARLSVAGLRAATAELDELGKEFHALREAVGDNVEFIERATRRAGTDREKPTDAAKILHAQDRVAASTARLEQMKDLAPLFMSKGYQQGLFLRELSARNISTQRPMGTRHLYEERSQRGRPMTYSDFQTLRESTAAAVAGIRTAIGSRRVIRDIPGLHASGGKIYADEGMSAKSAEKLEQATNHLAATQKRALQARAKGPGPELDKAEHELENAAVKFANVIAKLANGLAPAVSSLTGRNVQIPENIAGEERRQAARDAAAAAAKRKFAKPTAPQELAAAEDLLKRNTKELAEAKKKATSATKKLASTEERVANEEKVVLAGLTKAEREAYLALKERAKKAGEEVFKAGTQLARIEPIKVHQPGDMLPGQIGPWTQDQAARYEQDRPRREAQARLDAAQKAEQKARARMSQTFAPDADLAKAHQSAIRTNRAAAQAEAGLAAATKRSSAAVAQLRAEIEMVQHLAGTGATRKAISEQLGLSPSRITGILGPARAKKDATTDKIEKVVAAANTVDRAALRAERAVLQAGPHTRSDIKALRAAGRDDEAAVVFGIKQRLKEIKRQLDGAAGGGSGGGQKPPTARGGASGGGPEDHNILAKILAKLNEIHGTIKGGVRVTGRTSEGKDSAASRVATWSRTNTATAAELKAARGDDEQARMDAIEAQRRRRDRLPPSSIDSAHTKALEMEAARQRELQGASAKTASQLREEYHEASRLAAAMELLSAATHGEIAELERLNREGASQAKIAEQQVRVYNAMQRDLGALGVHGTDRRAAAGTVLNAIGPAVGNDELNQIARSARSQAGFSDLGDGLAHDAMDGFARTFGGKGFWNRVINTTGTFVVRNFAAGFVFGITNALQEVITQAIQTEATFVRVSSALEATGKDIGSLRGDLQGISTDYGIQLNDVYETAAGLAGLFDNSQDLAAGTRIVAQLQTISAGALNATEAMGVLASTLSAFEALPGQDVTDKLLPGGLEGARHVADVLTVVQNQMSVNLETTAEGVSRMAGLAREMKLSFEQTAVFTAQIAKQTNQTGAAAGEQFSRIIGALQTGRGRGAVTKAFGPQIEKPLAEGDYGKVFEVMIAGWDGLSDAQKRNVTVSVAGQRQAAAFNALMNNGQKTLNVLRRAEDANGDAADRMAKLMNTLNKQLDVLRSNAQNLASNLVRSGLLNFLGITLKLTNEVLGLVNSLLTAFNDFGDNNKFVGFLRTMVTTLVGAGVAIKLLQSGARGLKGALAAATPESVRTAAAARAEARAAGTGIVRPGWRSYGTAPYERYSPRPDAGMRRAPLSRLAGFGFDRTFGIAGEATARGIAGAGTRLEKSTNQFVQRTGRAFSLAGQGIGQAAERVRGAAQGFGSGSLTSRLNPLGRVGGLLSARADIYSTRAAELRAIHADQQRYAGYSGSAAAANRSNFERRLVAGGMSPEQVAQRTQAPNAALLRQAESMERMGRIAGTAGNATGRLSSSMSKMASSGALADGAMIALTVGLTALFGSLQRHTQDSKDLREGYEASFGEGRGKTSNQRREAEYVGKNFENFQEKWKADIEDSSIWSKGMSALGARFTNGLRGVVDEKYAYSREFGTNYDASETYGLGDANKLATEADKQLQAAAKSAGANGDSIRSVHEHFNVAVKEAADKIKADDSLSDRQKIAALANLEQAEKLIGDQANNLAAVADGLGSAVTMSADQVAQVQAAVQAIQQTGGATNIGGLDLGPIYQQLLADTGTEDSSRTRRILARMTSGGADDTTIALDNIKLLREQVISLQNTYMAKLESDPEAAADVKGQLLSTLSQYAQATDNAITTLQSNATEIATQAQATGNYSGAMHAYGSAMDRAEREFERQARAVRVAKRKAAKAEAAIQASIREMLGQPALVKPAPLPEGVTGVGVLKHPKQDEATTRAERQKRRRHDAKMAEMFQQMADIAITRATHDITLQIAQTADAGLRAALESKRAGIIASLMGKWNSGHDAGGTHGAGKWGNLAIDDSELLDAQSNAAQAETANVQAQKDRAAQARQDAAALRQARIGVAAAWADARGDAVASARAQVAMAAAAMAAAKADLAAATTASETSQAQAAVYAAQAQMIAAHAAVAQAQSDLVRSQYDVSIALAEAAGNTVEAARRTLAQARAALGAALRRSGGKATAEVNASRAEVIRAEAAARDAKLQDELDTIDFNLQMGKLTQSSAIQALREILRTHELTKAQRRQLLLQIKGMKDEMANSQWNFGDIKLPTPYQMRRYIEQRRQQFRGEMDSAAAGSSMRGQTGLGAPGSSTTNSSQTVNNVNIQIDGADVAKVKKIIREVVGSGTTTRTPSSARRR